MRTPVYLACLLVLTTCASGWAVCDDPPSIQNPGLTGEGGAVVGTVTGTVPDAWRAFAVGGAAANVEVIPLAPGELYPGSPATNAVRFRIDAFGADQGFDNDNSRFVIRPDKNYHAEFYIKSGNPDDSNQGFFLGFPVFNAQGAYLGREPGTNLGAAPDANVATGTWRKVRAISFMDPGASQGHVAFRCANDGGSGDAIMIAMPQVIASPEPVSNPGFERASNGGPAIAGATGPVPEDWRAFAVGGGSMTTSLVPLPANALYPGSPATNAMRLDVTAFGADQALDLDMSRFAISVGQSYQASVYVKSGNADDSNQGFRVGFPLFGGPPYTQDPVVSPYLGREPGAFNGVAGSAWQRVEGAVFEDSEAGSGAISFRLDNDGGTGNAILIALPSVRAPVSTPQTDVPNPAFAGTGGTIVGDVTGTVPDQWRAVAVTGEPPVPPPNIKNPDFEEDPDGTTAGGTNFIDTTTITGWRHFGVGGASASATVTAAAASHGAVGIELVRNSSGGDSALDKDQPPLREAIATVNRILKLRVDARDGGPHGGTPQLAVGFQFADGAFNRGVGFDPGADWETLGLTARTDTNGQLSVRFDLGPEGGRSVHLDNVRVEDVTEGADRMINGGFENSPAGLPNWRFFAVGETAGSVTLSNDAHSGARAALLEVTSDTGVGDIGLDIDPYRLACLGGEELTLSLAAKKVSGGDTRLLVVVAAYDINHAYIGNVAVVPVNPGTDAYQVFEGTQTLPENVRYLNVAFRVTDGSGTRTTGAYLIDDVQVFSPVEVFAPAAAQISTVPVAANAIFPGSPATNAVLWRQTVFGAGAGVAGFDHSLSRFIVEPAVRYHGQFYVKTANTDAADQAFRLELNLFNGDNPAGDPVVFTGTATNTWQLVEGPAASSLAADNGYIGFRVSNDGGADNAILIALPELVTPPATDNLVPNPTLSGSGGGQFGATGGPVPDDWRAFAVAGAAADIQIVPVAAGELFPGSPAVNAVQWTRTGFEGDAAVDHDAVRLPIRAGTPHRASIWAKTANPDGSPQQIRIGFPIFAGGNFLGREPGAFEVTVGSDWTLYEGPLFTDTVADNAHISVRVLLDGNDDSVLFALPRVAAICPVLGTIQPTAGINREDLAGVTITGLNFAAGMRVVLVRAGSPEIPVSNLQVIDSQTATFDLRLTGAAAGVYDVVICPSPGCEAGMLAGAFTVSGCSKPFADADADADVDQEDFGVFQSCITGITGDPGGTFDTARCGCFDVNGDLAVDSLDLGLFVGCVSGPEIPANPACAD